MPGCVDGQGKDGEAAADEGMGIVALVPAEASVLSVTKAEDVGAGGDAAGVGLEVDGVVTVAGCEVAEGMGAGAGFFSAPRASHSSMDCTNCSVLCSCFS
mgnify:CR=1 FL=1